MARGRKVGGAVLGGLVVVAGCASEDASHVPSGLGGDGGPPPPADASIDSAPPVDAGSDAGSGVGCLAQLGDRGVDYVSSAAVGGDGSLVFAGSFTRTLDLGGGVVAKSRGGTAAGYVAKLDRNCHGVFARAVGRVAPMVAVTPSGDVLVLIHHDATTVVDVGLGAPSPAGLVLAKLDPTGAAQWQSTIAPDAATPVPIAPTSFVATPAGEAVVAADYATGSITVGTTGLPAPPADSAFGFVALIDANGSVKAVDGLGIAYPTSRGWGETRADVDAAGAILISSACAAGAQVALPGGKQSCPGDGAFLAKANAGLTATLWMRAVTERSDVAHAPDGIVLTSGDTVTKIPDAATGTTWSKTVPSASFSRTAVSAAGTIVTSAYLSAASSFGGPTVAPHDVDATASAGGDPFVVAFDGGGNYLGAGHYRHVSVGALGFDPASGEVVVFADAVDKSDFGSGTLTSAYYASPDIVVVRAPDFAAPDPGPRPADVAPTPEKVLANAGGRVLANDSATFLLDQASIRQCAAAGCAAGTTTIFTDTASATIDHVSLAPDALAVDLLGFNSVQGGVYCPWSVGGCAAPSGVWYADDVLVDSGRLYWIEQARLTGGAHGAKQLKSCPRSDCSAPTLVGAGIGFAASDGTSLVLDDVDTVETTRGVFVRCPTSGCGAAPTRLVEGVELAGKAQIAGGGLFYRTPDAVLRCDVAGCGGLPSVVVSTWFGSGVAFTTDASSVYVLERTSTGRTIGKCPLTGCPATGPTAILAVLQSDPSSFAVGGGYVYWTTSDGALWRTPK